MSLGAGIFTFLSTELSTGDRLYPMKLKQGTGLPAHTYQRVSGDPELSHSDAQDHPLYSGIRYEEDRFQFSSYASTYDAAEEAALELRRVIVGYRGAWGDIQIEAVRPVLWLDDYEPDTELFRFIADYSISYLGGSIGS